jgi:hypothetical protein
MTHNLTKHALVMIVASVLSIVFLTQLSHALSYLFYWHKLLAKDLSLVFAHGHWGVVIQKVCALCLLPILLTALIGGLYGLVKRSQIPYLFHGLWVIWVILITGIAHR